MAPKAKALSEDQVKQIRESANFAKTADALGISEKRARAIKKATTFEEAMTLAQPASPKSVVKKKEAEGIVERIDESAIKPSPPPEPATSPASTTLAPGKPEAEHAPVPIQIEHGGDGTYRALIPEEIIGKGIPFKVTLSVRSIAYYQIASTINPHLSLGDFIDQCVHDTFEGRGLTLGLLKSGG